MKTQHVHYIGLVLLIIVMFFGSCEDENDITTDIIQNQVQENVQSKTWRITSFIESEKDETHHFTGYDFTFHASGVLNASNGINSYEGTWSITNSNSNV